MSILEVQEDERYKSYTDEELASLANAGDDVALESLIFRYKDNLRMKARKYFFSGADIQDVMQEGTIGLYKAVRDYRPDKDASFKTFAELCITRQILTAVKISNRKKHSPLNSYISLDKQKGNESSEQTLIDTISGTGELQTNPEDILISKERVEYIQDKMGKVLSPFEFEVITAYLEGESYSEMAEKMDKTPKSIDNALQRIKKKLEKYLNGENPLK